MGTHRYSREIQLRKPGEPLDEKPAETRRALGLGHRDSSSGSIQPCNPRFDSP
jgi:hypothetical protein